MIIIIIIINIFFFFTNGQGQTQFAIAHGGLSLWLVLFYDSSFQTLVFDIQSQVGDAAHRDVVKLRITSPRHVAWTDEYLGEVISMRRVQVSAGLSPL